MKGADKSTGLRPSSKELFPVAFIGDDISLEEINQHISCIN